MSTISDSSQPPETNQTKRSASPSGDSESTLPKQAKVSDEESRNDSREDAGPEKVGNGEPKHGSAAQESTGQAGGGESTGRAGEGESTAQAGGGGSARQESDSAAIAAAEALASLTGGDGGEDRKEMPCSSKKASREKSRDKSNRPSSSQSERRTEAAAADSSSSLLLCEDREDPEQASFVDDDDEEEEEDDDSLPGSSSTASSSVASDNEDGECAIVSVKMAPEVRQSVALLAQVQMRLDALEKKGARLHQRLELKLSRQRRPHLDQRNAITQSIPGFWVTALLNHPHLSTQIDETDEDALSYMTNLEIESFKNNKLGYRICFHFRRNPFFQNKMIVKEIHLGMGGSPVSFSNPILWQRGQNLVGSGEPRRTSQGVYQSFFHWFSDHSNPARDDIAQILKDDLYRNPLRYYLTPLWEPRENGSSAPKRQSSNNGDECVIISDSDEDEEQRSQNLGQEDEDDDQDGGSEEDDRDEGESSCEERDEEEVDVEEVEESRDSESCEVREQGREDEDIDIDEEKS
ncbi:putative testis-specific Y-encoded-like protein 3 isoform X1 [Carassius auratus]|uniref:Testis-specific Y-encoded-like protein 3 isoform X1 n=1 Tax=Carassius auratus TaxID=7957 RepID=A0A6P6P3W2_CARAU|nr:putative testis-specific Y-encoded-like protein 3 isoform X1 [Carassius auratus]